MERTDTPGSELLVAADLMLRDPKTLGADASVAEVREQLADPKVQLVLLTNGRAFKGAVTHIPPDAAASDHALLYADAGVESLSPHASADEAFERASASPTRRVIVLDDDRNLLGLLCLNARRTRFCGMPETDD